MRYQVAKQKKKFQEIGVESGCMYPTQIKPVTEEERRVSAEIPFRPSILFPGQSCGLIGTSSSRGVYRC